ncbi:hypothetical protein V3A08_07410 [Tenacibaculum maritimum]|uniref:hypothetical protein n=1 Tax=Tenacibaculum maritimum TaxID=107401 RepID=UPI003875BCB5
MEIWSFTTVFLFEKYDNQNKKWFLEYHFYAGKLFEKINIKTDWRTKAVKGKRKEAKFIGYVENLSFPVEYPITTTTGIKIERLKL